MRPKVSSLKLLHFNCKISHLQVQDRFQIPYFSSLYGIIERKTTRIQIKAAAVANKTSKQDGQLSYPCWIVNQWFLARYYYYYFFFPTAFLA